MTKNMTNSLIDRLQTADVVCTECGCKYGKYSAGCSSMWTGTCHVCGKTKPVTEVRDFGYLQQGIDALQKKDKIRTQSKVVALYMCNQEENDEPASYEQGEITLKLSEDEVDFLNECLDVICENHESLCGNASEHPKAIALFESIEKKITDLYQDNCVEYKLSPVTAAYHKKYGTFGLLPEEAEHYRKFKESYDMLVELGFITEDDNS